MEKPSESAFSTPFAAFAAAAEAISGTAGRNEKSDRLAGYASSLNDDDFALAVRYFAGHIFPLHDGRTVQVGHAALLTAMAAVTGADGDHLRTRIVEMGDIGSVAHEAMAGYTPAQKLSLAAVARFFEELAATSGSRAKAALVTEFLGAASALEAKYLVRLLSGDMRTGLLEGGVEAALARMTGAPVSRIKWANMLTGDLGETALLARHNRLDTARMRLFHPIKFMLASPAEKPEDVARQMPDGFAVEDKFDGIRAQAHVALDPPEADLQGAVSEGVRVALFSRTLDNITRSFPDLVDPLARLAGSGQSLILDGEIVPVDGDRILPFQVLQRRLGRKVVAAEIQRECPVAYVVFDVLFADGAVLLEEPYTSRRERLDALSLPEGIRRSASTRFTDVAVLDEAFDQARERGNEGLMVKSPDSIYKPGRRGREWLKVKKALATLDVVVTAVEVGNGARRHLLSDYTFAVRRSEEDPTLLNIGKAYSGLTDAELGRLTEWFKANTLQSFAHGRVRVVEPQVVIEVAFDRVQPSSRHKSGYALRFPRIVRLREDKPPAEIDTLDTVRKLAGAPE